VLVEAGLLAPSAEAAGEEHALRPRLQRMVEDLAGEGWSAALVSVELPGGGPHRDGLRLLALRELLRGVAARAPLAGVTLVGRFPDALLVRTCNWRRRGDLELHRGTPAARRFEDAPYLRRVPEDVAHRADVVLGDLDGRWEERYRRERTELATVLAVFPGGIPEEGGEAAAVERGSVAFEDFFLVDDGRLELDESCEVLFVRLDDRDADRECGERDRRRPNALPVPEVAVSRLDARGTALRPAVGVVGVDGQGLLDADGNPRTVRFASAEEVPRWLSVWEHDPGLERRLLAEALDRNHGYRSGAARVVRRPASFAHDLGSGYRSVEGAAEDWEDEDRGALDRAGRPGLVELVAWLREPALLRTLRAHSDPWGSALERGGLAELEGMVGVPRAWSASGDALVPSLRDACGGGKLDYFLLRTLWQNGGLGEAGPSLWLHTGCHGISPPGALTLPFDDPRYGVRQGAEALLFLAEGLALLGRSKVFYDEPAGFAEVLARGGTMGDAWIEYFERESRAPGWDRVGGDIGRKRATFWGLLGDWSLRLAPAGE
jgi:hypothetical protein